ncbi:MAG: C40 family peptidase [Deltaproteobacteria bacterium]|jgi:cell wall-associated NlpC family hydrolase|nr:C40 family peptidase [Deltaproteobacteria bacterium]
MKNRHLVILSLIAVIGLFFLGCASKKAPSGLGMEVARTAHKFIGSPYKYGGRSPKGFDCSGLVWYVYKQYGINLPDASHKQASAGFKVKRDELVPGDLIFFQTNGRIHHVGLYVGGNKMIHAPGKGKKVVKTSLKDKYYRSHYATSRRVAD